MGSTRIVSPRASLDDLAEAHWDQIMPHAGGLEYEHLFGTKELELVIRSTDEGNLLAVRPTSRLQGEETPELAYTPAPETWEEVVSWCRMVAAMHSPS